MSKVLKTVGIVAGVVALAASVAVTAGATAPVFGATLASIAATAGTVATIANIGAGLTAKAPPAQGSVTQTTIGTDQPSPYLVGRTFYAGSRIWLTGYGADYKKVKSPYLLATDVYSVGGPVDGLEQSTADMAAVSFSGTAATGYFGGFLWRSAQLGAMPETSALALHFGGATGWSGASALSGKAAIAWNALFDKDGKVFASGFAPMGAVWRGVLCYDPRLDSTYPGGSGPHRWADPANTAGFDAARATWTYSTSPGLHALHYALGRWERDPRVSGSRYRKTFGVGMPIDGLIVDHFVHLANVCDANGWQAGGVLAEPVSSKWDNLKRLLAAGAAEPSWSGGRLGVRVSAPRVPLDTITASDLADGEIVVGAMAGWEQRLNTLVPKYRSEAHRWEYVAADPVQISTYLAEDGEEKREERQIDLVQDATQAAQICAYELLDRRELGEIELPCKPRLRRYGPGDLLIVNLPEAGLVNQPAVVLTRSLDPATMGVKLTLRGETAAKHAFALGKTGTPPPTPALGSTEAIDGSAASASADVGAQQQAIATSFPLNLTIAAADTGSITISDHTRRYTDGHADVAVTGATIASGLSAGSFRAIYYDDETRTGGAITYALDPDDINARVSPAHPGRHFVGYVTIPTAGSPPSEGGGATPPGGRCVTEDTPVLMADGTTKRAGDLIVGDQLLTRHEERLTAIGGGWGVYPVEATETVDTDDVWQATIAGRALMATGDHRVWTGDWVHMRDLPGATQVGSGRVVKLTVTSAHTYVSNDVLSHNLKPTNGE